MHRHPHQNPAPALLITAIILAGMAALGLYNRIWKQAGDTCNMQVSFISEPVETHTSEIHCVPAELPAPPLNFDSCDLFLLPPPELCEVELSDEIPPPPEEELIPQPEPYQHQSPPPLNRPRHQVSANTTASPTKSVILPSAPHTTAQHTPPAYFRNPPPTYPATLRLSGRKGSVQVRIYVDTKGKPTQVEILRSNHPLFSNAARDCILRSWHFKPATTNGKPSASFVTTTIHFSLR